jgi:hypothetical protein
MFPRSKNFYTASNCISANKKQNSYRQATTRANASVSQSYAVPFHQGHVHSCIYTEFQTMEFTLSEYILQFWIQLSGCSFTCIHIHCWQTTNITVPQIISSNYTNVFLTLTCKSASKNVSYKSDICVSIVYKYYRIWSGLEQKQVMELWKQNWKWKTWLHFAVWEIKWYSHHVLNTCSVADKV